MVSAETNDGQAARLERFLRDWRHGREGDKLVRRLERFCARANPLFNHAPIRRRRPQIDPVRLSVLLPRIREALLQGGSSSVAINPWTAAGLARREVRNAGVLASLWSATLCGSAGVRFLREFLSRVERADEPLPDAAELAAGYIVRTEHCPGAGAADRVDIVVESARHIVGIEIKIDAGEGDRQLERYVEALERSGRRLGKRSHVILLAPFRSPRSDVLPANWPLVRAAAEASLPDLRSEWTFAHDLIASFATHVRRF